ncbi:GerAB/ArcD/ProY family transporter [Niallia nealsonii]|uniref:Spore gernimation protein KC n=1 Tax=Niallia nealsonii TaxID=115979 RepID=A0A2N0Z719_9BACI|nr:GerAB/ArcD/ProY family transporter [Niallia nealsonii]PKG25311.1 spore gernimation protein KC [Niallia nealsonii]
MLKEHISLGQIFAVVLSFNLGSSLVLGIGIKGKEDAWLVVFSSSLLGIIITIFFYYLIEMLPKKNLYELFAYCYNRKIAIILSFIYIIYFFYLACRVIRDFTELTSSIILPLTPIEIITLSLTLLMGYILYMGIEVLSRTTEVLLPYSIVFLITLAIFLYASGNIIFSKITPILAQGIKPLMKVIFPYELVRPYGQMVAFTCVFPLVANFRTGKNIVLLAITISGLFLTLSTLLITLSLGSNSVSKVSFPLLSATRLVSIGGFIERIDAISVFIIMLGILVKSGIFIYAGMMGLEYIFKISYRYFTIPIICIISMFTIFIARGISDHILEGFMIIPYFLSIPLEFALPVFLAASLLVKRKLKK